MYVRTHLKEDTEQVIIIRGTYLLSGLVNVHEVYTGAERGVLSTIQEYAQGMHTPG